MRLADHFFIPVDDTVWNSTDYEKNKEGRTPHRPRASFATWGKGLVPKSAFAKSLINTYGVYLLAFDTPYRSLYVGIAGDDSAKPEGVLKRLKKHRVKATGSNVAARQGGVGGVHHPQRWGQFAKDRYIDADTLQDVQFAVGSLSESNPKAILEYFENAILNNQDEVLAELCERFWGDRDVSSVYIITGASVARLEPDSASIKILG